MGPQNIAYPGAPKQMGQNAFQPQQYFPMPQGNVYTIEQPEEVNSVPCGTGVSVALCLNKGLMYIKSMQGGSPLFWVYKISPAMETPSVQKQERKEETEDRVARLEQKIDKLLKEVNGNESKPQSNKLVID